MYLRKKTALADGKGDSDIEIFATMCKALGHPARIMIVNYLRQIDRCFCGDIVQQLPLAQSTVSQHLKCLKNAGLITGQVEGPKTCYCIDRKMLEEFIRMASELGLSAGNMEIIEE